jgi:hypothetical protein
VSGEPAVPPEYIVDSCSLDERRREEGLDDEEFEALGSDLQGQLAD